MMKKLYKVSLTAVMLLLYSSVLLAQDRTVTGTVTDENGQPLPGVNVLIKGTSKGTVSDTDGAYTLAGVNDNSTLVFSFIGYLSQEVAVGTRTVVDAGLQLDVTSLEEVVVVGYGEQKKSLTTAAISSVKGEDLQNISIGQTEQALQGRTAGVLVSPNSGSPGSAARISIRGVGSSGTSSPLYIVDGVRLGGANALDFLNPNDIASMEILKDAASAAIYGADGANGVIIITTKKGKVNQTSVTYSGQYGVQSLRPNAMKVMNAQQYVQFLEEANVTGRPTAADIPADGGTDWLDVTFDNAPQQSHSLEFSSGTEKSTFFMGTSYFKQEGIAGGDKAAFERYTIRLNTSTKLNNWLTVGENLTFTKMNREGLPEDSEYGGLIQGAVNLDPLTPVTYTGALPTHAQEALDNGHTLIKDENGNYYGVSKWVAAEFGNPLTRYSISKAKTDQNRLIGNVYADITPIKGFKFTTRVGLTGQFNRMHNWNPSFWFNSERLNDAPTANDDWSQGLTTLWENFASYDKTVGDHHFVALLGHAYQMSNWNWLNGSYSSLFRELEKWSYADFVPDAVDRIGSGTSTETLLSYFGRLSYDFKGKYLLDATVRRDGSSKLSDGNRVGVFPAVSAGWVISNEDFFASASSLVSYLKLRASWGQNGSLSNIQPGQWTKSITPTLNGNIQYADANGVYVFGAAPNQLANPQLTWETSEQLDIGVDFRMLNDRLIIGVDYFKKTTKDLLAPGNPPGFVGLRLPFINAGAVENKGIELEVTYKSDLSKDFTYEISGNLTTLHNEVTELSSQAGRPKGADISGNWRDATVFEVGEPIWYFSGYKTDGIFQNQAEIDEYLSDGLTGYAPKPGDVRIVDYNGDKLISPSDFTNIGNPTPKFYYGLRTNLGYKGFDLTMFLQGVSGNDVLMGTIRTDRSTTNKPDFFYTDRWTGEGSTNSWFRPVTTGEVYTSDKMIFNGSFMRVRQLQLGYRLPTALISTIGLKNVRFYISLDNFFTFTKYPGLDPEAGTPRVNSLGVDRGVYPIPRKVLGGVSFTF